MLSKEQVKRTAILLAAIVLYGAANYISGKKYLPGCSFAELRPQICLPIFMGIYYGPLAGFLTGAGGDSLGYVFAGNNPLVLWHWALANGLIGFIPGFAAYFHVRKVTTLKGMQTLYLLLFLATSLPFVFSCTVEYLLGHMAAKEAFALMFLPICVTDALFAILIIPPCLLAARLLVITIPTAIFLMTTYLTSWVALATFAASMYTLWGRRALSTMAASNLYTIGVLTLIVIMIGFALAALFVRRITLPILTLTQTADDIANEDYESSGKLGALAERSDELGRLAGAFESMVTKVRAREEKLKAEVRELHIVLDKSRQQKEVSKITGSDYFKKLKSRAAELRLKEDET
jgi:HAMP domain-containing protein